MTGQPEALESLTRDELVAEARRLGLSRPELMTRVELGDEILRWQEARKSGRGGSRRGWLGVARDLVARLVDKGLNLPTAAAAIRSMPTAFMSSRLQAPVATVTLAEIYSAQGHARRALAMLEEVLAKEPDHEAARTLYERISAAQPRASIPEAASPPGPIASAVSSPDALSVAPAAPSSGVASGTSAMEDRDAVVVVSGAPGGVSVYWQLSARTLTRRRRGGAIGDLAVRVLEFVPSWNGAETSQKDLPLTAPRGSIWLDLDRPDTVVRTVLGDKSGGVFLPLAADCLARPDGSAAAGWQPSEFAGESGAALRRRAVSEPAIS